MPRYINPENIKITAVALSDEDGTELVSLADVRNAIAQTPSERVFTEIDLAAKRCALISIIHEAYIDNNGVFNYDDFLNLEKELFDYYAKLLEGKIS